MSDILEMYWKDYLCRDEDYWINEGEKHIAAEYMELWRKCVPVRLTDLYMGIELKFTIDIVKVLNKSDELTNDIVEEAKMLMIEQKHSGWSCNLVCSMIKSFHKNGEEFIKRIN